MATLEPSNSQPHWFRIVWCISRTTGIFRPYPVFEFCSSTTISQHCKAVRPAIYRLPTFSTLPGRW